jgi:hypothetical protein
MFLFSFSLSARKAAQSARWRFVADCAICATFFLVSMPVASAQDDARAMAKNSLFGMIWFVLATVWLLIMCSRILRQRRPKRPRYLRRRISRRRFP